MKLIFTILAAVALLFSVEALVLPSLINSNSTPLGINLFNATQNSVNGSSIISNGGSNNNIPNSNIGATGGCYAVYAETLYEILVVGGAKLRFCAQNVGPEIVSQTVSQFIQTELANISAEMNIAAGKFTFCLTASALLAGD